MMGHGDKRIGVAELTKLLPCWLQSAGFTVVNDDDRGERFIGVRTDTIKDEDKMLARWISRLMGLLTITDGTIQYKVDDTDNVTWINVKPDDDGR